MLRFFVAMLVLSQLKEQKLADEKPLQKTKRTERDKPKKQRREIVPWRGLEAFTAPLIRARVSGAYFGKEVETSEPTSEWSTPSSARESCAPLS